MTKKKLASALIIVLLSYPLRTFADKSCECGEHATGITTYHVTGGDDCCTSTPGQYGWYYTYSQQSSGVWQLDTQTQISGTAAQDACCEDSGT